MPGTKRFIQRVVVKGVGQFPIDMLRYDSCVPWGENDSYQMTGLRDTREIALRRFAAEKSHAPTLARWNSFGWDVLHWELVP